MASEEKIELHKIVHVAIVVRDLKKTIENYWKVFGIGPWSIYTYTPPDLKDTHVRGKPVYYTMKIGFATVGSVGIELVEHLEGASIYKEFLEEKGEGLHHIYFEGYDFNKLMAQFKKQGIEVLMDATYKGVYWAYMDTEKILGFIVEISKPVFYPHATYPLGSAIHTH